MEVHWAITKAHLATAVPPGERVLEPGQVIALGVIFAGMGAAALCAVGGGMEHDHCLAEQIVELERLDEISVPDHRAIGDDEIAQRMGDGSHLPQAFTEHMSRP